MRIFPPSFFSIDVSADIKGLIAKMNFNKQGMVFVVDTNNVLLGGVSDGDLRRGLLNASDQTNTLSIASIMNRDVISVSQDNVAQARRIEQIAQLKCVPVVDSENVLVSVVAERPKDTWIGSKLIALQSKTYVIAEIGNNHNGSLELAKTLIDHAVKAGADCVKFQLRSMKDIYTEATLQGEASELSVEYTVNLLKKYSLQRDELADLKYYADTVGIDILCTPWDSVSVDVLENLGFSAIKIASADSNNSVLLERVMRTQKPLIISTGMRTDEEVQRLIQVIDGYYPGVILMHCNSTYPAPYSDINLNYMNYIKEKSDRLVGYSGHERGWHVAVAAVAMGAKVIEKHLTVDRSMEGADHKASLLPEEFAKMVRDIRDVEVAIQGPKFRRLSQGEVLNRESLGKCIYVNKKMQEGQVLTRDDLILRSPGGGLEPDQLDSLIGVKLAVAKRDGDKLFIDDVMTASGVSEVRLSFEQPIGIPVRFHDFESLITDREIDFVEFHFSCSDLDREVPQWGELTRGLWCSAHCPEQFDNDHIIDLCSSDEAYRCQSVKYVNAALTKAKLLADQFDQDRDIPFICNIGGMSADGFLVDSDVRERVDKLLISMSELDLDGVNFLPQTMPPFPWHFGGQAFHNLFVDARSIVELCDALGCAVCLDVSHSYLAAMHTQVKFTDFVNAIKSKVQYLHVADAAPPNAEGLMIGDGDVDFKALKEIFGDAFKSIPFIPEVWQGHVAGGAKFWKSFNILEKQWVGDF